MAVVSLASGAKRRDTIRKSLEMISSDIRNELKPGLVIIKPNFVSTTVQLAASHVDQIRGILDCVSEFYERKIMIAEAASGDTLEGYRNFGYEQLSQEYNIELFDLNEGPFKKVPIRDRKGNTIYVRVSGLLLDRQNYLISAAKLKTHDTVVATLSIKNVIMGSIYARDKSLVHQGYRQINYNIAKMADLVWPDLSVIDGVVGMEGDGPTYGNPKESGVAISSVNALAADRVACEVMGVEFNKVGYLSHCMDKGLGVADLENIYIKGENLNKCIRPFKLHSTVQQQYEWR